MKRKIKKYKCKNADCNIKLPKKHLLFGYCSEECMLLEDSQEQLEQVRLDQTIKVFKAIKEHLDKPASFRHLIYSKLGFDEKSYSDLYLAGGLEISNACHDLEFYKHAVVV